MAKGTSGKKKSVSGNDQKTRRPCTCANKYQDENYGKGVRIFTTGVKQHCTICGKEPQ